MRLSRSAILSNRRKNQRVSKVKQKHKRLDAICEKTYTQNRVRIESPKLSEFNGDASEVRRSCRVRRAPLVLDASPLPTKKRKISEGSGDGSSKRVGERGRDLVGLKTELPCSTRRDLEEEESVEWKSRLRARDRIVTFGTGNSSSPRSKRNLFGHSNGLKEQLDPVDRHLDDKKGGLVGETLRVVRSKRSARTKASNVLSNGYENIDLENNDKEEEDTSEVQAAKHKNKDSLLEEGVIDNNAVELLEQGNDVLISFKSNISNIEQSVEHNRQMEQLEYEEREGQSFHQKEAGSSANHVGDSTIHTNNLQDENSKKVGEDKYSPAHRQHKPRIKKGRCCGLCGGGTDGKPPKKLVHDEIGSDNEAYSGSSSSEEPTYDIWDGFGDEPGWLGQLLGPINDRYGIAGIWVHQHCAVWSPEVYFAGLGCLKNVRSALCRGKVLKCSRCGRRGATIGCRVDRCPKTYHLPCARANGCIFDHRKFLIACTDHRLLFQPHGSKYFDRLKKIKAKKMKSEMRKLSNDAWRKDHEAEEKWLENCGEDEEFLKRESKRLHRDLFRIAPEYIGGSKKSDNEIPFQGWESVGGLQDVIQSLKEVVILPLLYPEFFNNIGLTPPRGVLLHGYPGTGKTLVVRALIGSCARGDRRIAYFARKGADCLGKYVGDAERQLRLLFQVAEKSQPSIIFFDEIDGLAPSRTRQQDQTHNSVVSTLLALLDGLKSRGSVVVIGATNRPDAIDPALRRPGRFDREIYFPLPSVNDREAILSLHTQKWPNPVSGSLLKLIARRTVGFAGADLQALCTQTAIIALKRRCPWDKLLLAAEDKAYKRPVLPTFSVEERDWLEALSNAPPPCSRREAGMAANDIVSSPLPVHLFRCMLQPLSKLLVSLYLDEHIFLPGPLSKAAETIKNVIVSVMDGKKENSDCWWSHVQDFLKEADVASDVESNLLRANHLVGDSTFGGFDASDDDTNDGCVKFGPSRVHNGFLRNNLLHGVSHSSGKKPGFCVLISGSPRSGQRHLASCILHGFVGNVVLQKVDLATMSQEGGGDMVQGLTQILVRCANVGSCMIFMPRIDLWALETCHQVDEEENCFSTKGVKSQEPVLSASDLWNSFVEQAESIFISSSLTILATTEVPFESLPIKIKDFFGKNKQNLGPSNHTGSTIPRFSVNLDGNFNRDMVIASAAARLSNDIARYFVQLIHHKTHIHETSFDPNKSFNTIYADADKVNPNTDSSMKYTSKNQNSSLATPNRKDEKGKSNLMLAISTFGYQILQYPHFAELCWVTSKLKDGPFAEINGPWKGWPFNSCIVRPSERSVNVAGASGSGNIKSKEKYGLVRGLIAVGLSAYRGVYLSVREVAAEVRKVLELLTLQINAKVEGGKDRYQFVRLLSQVAYLEDMVNSWAYTLQSLETVPKLNEGKTSKNNLVQCDDCVNKTSQLEHTEESTEQFDNQAINGLDPKEGDGCTMHTGQAASVADGLNPTMPAHWSGSASSKDQPDAHLVNESNGLVLEPSTLKNSATSNGFCEESVAFPNDGPKEVNNSISNGKNNVDPTTPTDVCLYQFCLTCISNLESVMQKALITQRDIKSNILKIEDIHDEITSLSLNLYTSVREFCHDKNLQVDNIISFFGACECEHSGRKRVPVATDDYSRYGSELIYKNGVLASLDTETDLSFHCKFQKLCLCSLIEYIVMMTKQPSG